MEALYGYMTKHELNYAITEKEFDVEMKRLLLESEYITESGNEKSNILIKMLQAIKTFLKEMIKRFKIFMKVFKNKAVMNSIEKNVSIQISPNMNLFLPDCEKALQIVLSNFKNPAHMMDVIIPTYDNTKMIVSGPEAGKVYAKLVSFCEGKLQSAIDKGESLVKNLPEDQVDACVRNINFLKTLSQILTRSIIGIEKIVVEKLKYGKNYSEIIKMRTTVEDLSDEWNEMQDEKEKLEDELKKIKEKEQNSLYNRIMKNNKKH